MKAVITVFAAALLLGILVAANWPGARLPTEVHADSLLLRKQHRALLLFADNRLVKSYSVALGRVPVGAKREEGDHRTPEGLYHIDSRLQASAFHRALRISYPDSADRAAARARGVQPGGAIMIHGLRHGLGWIGRLHRFFDWTSGCIAVTNPEIDELWRAVPDGTPVRIVP
jgi:murein L,D-transpeptidase YafK